MINILIACDTEKTADDIADLLLTKRLIGCANIFPIKSKFWWKEKIESSDEIMLICKTTDDKFEKIKTIVEDNHPYDTPLIESIKTDNVNNKYLDWLKSEVEQ